MIIFGLSFICLVLGIVYDNKKKPEEKKLAKTFFILLFVFLVIGIGTCGKY